MRLFVLLLSIMPALALQSPDIQEELVFTGKEIHHVSRLNQLYQTAEKRELLSTLHSMDSFSVTLPQFLEKILTHVDRIEIDKYVRTGEIFSDMKEYQTAIKENNFIRNDGYKLFISYARGGSPVLVSWKQEFAGTIEFSPATATSIAEIILNAGAKKRARIGKTDVYAYQPKSAGQIWIIIDQDSFSAQFATTSSIMHKYRRNELSNAYDVAEFQQILEETENEDTVSWSYFQVQDHYLTLTDRIAQLLGPNEAVARTERFAEQNPLYLVVASRLDEEGTITKKQYNYFNSADRASRAYKSEKKFQSRSRYNGNEPWAQVKNEMIGKCEWELDSKLLTGTTTINSQLASNLLQQLQKKDEQ